MSKYHNAVKKAKPVKAAPIKKGAARVLNTKALPKKTNRVTVKLGLSEWRKLFGESERFPLSMRVAAEFYRSGVFASEFESKMHFDDNTFSKNVLEHLSDMDAGRGVEPETVPPVLPVFLEYQKSERKHGRPSSVDAVAEFRRFADGLRKVGWADSDIQKGAESLIKAPVTKKVVVVVDDEDLAPIKVTKVVWPIGHTGCCPICDRSLNGLSLRVKDDDTFTDYHHACYLLKMAKPVDLTHGQSVLNPADAKTYVWNSTKPAWQIVEQPGEVEEES